MVSWCGNASAVRNLVYEISSFYIFFRSIKISRLTSIFWMKYLIWRLCEGFEIILTGRVIDVAIDQHWMVILGQEFFLLNGFLYFSSQFPENWQKPNENQWITFLDNKNRNFNYGKFLEIFGCLDVSTELQKSLVCREKNGPYPTKDWKKELLWVFYCQKLAGRLVNCVGSYLEAYAHAVPSFVGYTARILLMLIIYT